MGLKVMEAPSSKVKVAKARSVEVKVLYVKSARTIPVTNPRHDGGSS